MLKVIETDRLLLKPLGKEAAPMVLSFYEDNRTLFEPWEPSRSCNFYSLAYHKASLTAEINQMAEGKLIRYWVFIKDRPDEIIGSICFQNLLKDPYRSCCLGYKFSRRFLRRGYAFESISKGIEVIFGEYFLHRIEAYVMYNNEPSRKLLEKLSFQFEGISYSYAKINGIWADHNRYSLINPRDILKQVSEASSTPEVM